MLFDPHELEEAIQHDRTSRVMPLVSTGHPSSRYMQDGDDNAFGDELLDPRDVLTERWQVGLPKTFGVESARVGSLCLNFA
jgi:hypothetical protein